MTRSAHGTGGLDFGERTACSRNRDISWEMARLTSAKSRQRTDAVAHEFAQEGADRVVEGAFSDTAGAGTRMSAVGAGAVEGEVVRGFDPGPDDFVTLMLQTRKWHGAMSFVPGNVDQLWPAWVYRLYAADMVVVRRGEQSMKIARGFTLLGVVP